MVLQWVHRNNLMCSGILGLYTEKPACMCLGKSILKDLMGCGSGQKSTSSTVIEAQRLRNKPAVVRSQKHPPSGERYKLDPEVLDGFGKVMKRGMESLKPAVEVAVPEEPRKPVKVEYQAPNVSNPFGDLLKGEQAKVRLEEHRHSPEPPRPQSASSNEDNAPETQAKQAVRRDNERKVKEEGGKAADREGQLTGMQAKA